MTSDRPIHTLHEDSLTFEKPCRRTQKIVAEVVYPNMTSYPRLPVPLIQTLLAARRQGVIAAAPSLASLDSQLLAGLTPEEWPAEWHLPWWIGCDFGLGAAQWRSLTLVNLYGLSYVWLVDELIEGHAAGHDARDARFARQQAALAAVLHELALAELTSCCGHLPEVWQWRSRAMAEWLQTLDADAAPAQPFAAWTPDDFLHLAWRGAPLKIGAAAACLLAGQGDCVAPLAAAVDHLLVAQVLLDHVDDWRDDLAGGRFNAFVAFASPLPQQPAHVQTHTRQVLALLMLGNPQPYFSLVYDHAQRAGALARQAGCRSLASFVAVWLDEARRGCDGLAQAAHGELHRAVDFSL